MSAKYSMLTKRHLDLSTFDGRLLNGLDFCRKVYDLLDLAGRTGRCCKTPTAPYEERKAAH
jgi:hypothetical protein